MAFIFSFILLLISQNIYSQENLAEKFEGRVALRLSLVPGGVLDIKAPIIHTKILEDGGHFSCSLMEVEVLKMDSGLLLRDIEIKKILGVNQKVVATEIFAVKNKKTSSGSALININKISKKIIFKFILTEEEKLKAIFYLKLSDFNITVPEYMGAKVKNEVRAVAYLNFTSSQIKVKAKREKRPVKMKKST